MSIFEDQVTKLQKAQSTPAELKCLLKHAVVPVLPRVEEIITKMLVKVLEDIAETAQDLFKEGSEKLGKIIKDVVSKMLGLDIEKIIDDAKVVATLTVSKICSRVEEDIVKKVLNNENMKAALQASCTLYNAVTSPKEMVQVAIKETLPNMIKSSLGEFEREVTPKVIETVTELLTTTMTVVSEWIVGLCGLIPEVGGVLSDLVVVPLEYMGDVVIPKFVDFLFNKVMKNLSAKLLDSALGHADVLADKMIETMETMAGIVVDKVKSSKVGKVAADIHDKVQGPFAILNKIFNKMIIDNSDGLVPIVINSLADCKKSWVDTFATGGITETTCMQFKSMTLLEETTTEKIETSLTLSNYLDIDMTDRFEIITHPVVHQQQKVEDRSTGTDDDVVLEDEDVSLLEETSTTEFFDGKIFKSVKATLTCISSSKNAHQNLLEIANLLDDDLLNDDDDDDALLETEKTEWLSGRERRERRKKRRERRQAKKKVVEEFLSHFKIFGGGIKNVLQNIINKETKVMKSIFAKEVSEETNEDSQTQDDNMALKNLFKQDGSLNQAMADKVAEMSFRMIKKQVKKMIENPDLNGQLKCLLQHMVEPSLSKLEDMVKEKTLGALIKMEKMAKEMIDEKKEQLMVWMQDKFMEIADKDGLVSWIQDRALSGARGYCNAKEKLVATMTRKVADAKSAIMNSKGMKKLQDTAVAKAACIGYDLLKSGSVTGEFFFLIIV